MKTRTEAIEHAHDELVKLKCSIWVLENLVPELPESDVFVWRGIVQITVDNPTDLAEAQKKLGEAGWKRTGEARIFNSKVFYAFDHPDAHREYWPYALDLAIEAKEIIVDQFITNREIVVEA